MTAKEYLKQYEYADRRARHFRELYEEQQEKIDAIGSTLAGDGLPHGTGVSRKTEDKAIRLSEAALAWKEAELDALMIRGEVFAMIEDVPGTEGEILYQRYIKLMPWEKICVAINYTWSSTHRAHRRALAIVQERLDKLTFKDTK